MPATFAVSRPWQLNLGGNTPDEWGMAPYNNVRTTMQIYSASGAAAGSQANQPASQLGYYDWTNGAEARTSAAVRIVDLAGKIEPGVPTGGFYIINGLAPSGTSGINFVARFALLACIRTFLDAGAPTSFGNTSNQVGSGGPTFRVLPIPLVQITYPSNHQDRSHINPLTIDWKERYARWDNLRYTENYPCVDGPAGSPCPGIAGGNGNPAVEWHDSTNLIFNVIYSEDDANWFSAPTGDNASPGIPLTDVANIIPYQASHQYAFSWDVSLGPNMHVGNKHVRVECFRLNPKGDVMQHYSYHEIQVVTAP